MKYTNNPDKCEECGADLEGWTINGKGICHFCFHTLHGGPVVFEQTAPEPIAPSEDLPRVTGNALRDQIFDGLFN